jgi:hypothetical protein
LIVHQGFAFVLDELSELVCWFYDISQAIVTGNVFQLLHYHLILSRMRENHHFISHIVGKIISWSLVSQCIKEPILKFVSKSIIWENIWNSLDVYKRWMISLIKSNFMQKKIKWCYYQRNEWLLKEIIVDMS